MLYQLSYVGGGGTRIARGHEHARVASHTRRVSLIVLPLGVPATVADVLRAVRDDDRPFVLTGEWAGSRAIVGSEPRAVVEGAHVLEVLDGGSRDGTSVGGGWFGYLGFGLGRSIELLPHAPPRPMPLPEASMAYYDHVFRQDAGGNWWFEALDEAALPRLDAVRAKLTATPRGYELGDLHTHHTGRHLAAVADCVERIAAGELFQANLTLRLEGRFRGSAPDAYLAAAERLQPSHGAFIDLGDRAILSFSPEQFLRRHGERVTTSPIKGTTTDDTPDGLARSAKDAAEHVMIVDLSRNDLGRVARYGTVEPGPRRAERHPGLWHLVTDVTATVPDETTDADIIRAAFPPGSVTGAPKLQALKVIAALEGTQREAYTGAIGFASPHAGLQLSVAIRTLELSGEQAWMGCGGGIVADSQPYAELEEALSKARPIAAALGARVIAHASRLAPSTSTTTPRPWPRRPDPNRGLLETIAVRDHQLVDATPHLERLVASARHLYGLELDPLAIDPEIALGRIRVSLTPDGEMTVTQHAEIPDPSPLALEPRTLAGGLGRHKWLDRTGEPHHLVVDLGVDVLETATANVWALVDGSLITPTSIDGILAGKEDNWTIGVNWYLRSNFKLAANYVKVNSTKYNPNVLVHDYVDDDPSIIEFRAQFYW